ncbi:PREDICTED: uncharacterized protein LOC108368474 [Rhagoletis zephyria]|uniref:uncharacterized protein LOC108368474 n=1 Tax=Rhagoletis zephyria TaxID=28612 RepID=UPI000811215A|nr:PREDICTED: uncharacterized protein LOC108368474 [Rhagoletis zephyria]
MLSVARSGLCGRVSLLVRESYVVLARIQKPCTAGYPTSSKRFHVHPQQEPRPQQQLAMGYNIDWIFSRLRCPSGLWYIFSQIAITAVGLFAKFVLDLCFPG